MGFHLAISTFFRTFALQQTKRINNMEKSYWLINVSGRHGYSMVVHGEIDDDYEAIETASKANLFNDEEDADYATAEEASEYDIKHFTEKNLVVEL